MSNLTASDIEAIVRDLKDEAQFRDRNTEWKENRLRVHRQKPVIIPGIEMETQYLTPDLMDAADKYTARFLGAPFTINVSAQGPGPVAIKKAQAMENYDYRLTHRWVDGGLLTGAIHDMCGVTGEGWVHMTLNRELLPIVPIQEDGEDDEAYLTRGADVWKEFESGEKPDLIQLEPVSEPETIYYNKDRSLIFMCAEVPLAPLQRQYGREGAGGLYGERGKSKGINKSGGLYEITTIDGAVDPEGFNAAIYRETALLYIVETADYIYHLLEDGAAPHTGGNSYAKMHRLGCYKNVFGAPGFVWVHGRKTNHPSAQFSVHPLTHAALAIAPQVNIMGTIIYSGGIYGEMTRIQLDPMPGPEAALERANNKSKEIELIGNRCVSAPDGYKFSQPNIGVNADTLNAFASLEAKMQKYGYDPALDPNAQMQATSGYQQAVLRDMAADTLDPPLHNIASMINKLLSLKDTAIKTLNKPITFSNFAATDEIGPAARSVREEITIHPDDIVDVDRSVSFDSLTQYARTALIELGEGLLSRGHATEDEFLREFRGIDDPIRWKKQRLVEKAMTIAEEAALKASAAVFQRVTGDVAQEAMADTGLAAFAPPTGNGTGGVSVSNGAGGAAPLQPAPPNPQAELTAVGGNPGAMS